MVKKATKNQVKKERSQSKLKRVLVKKGYTNGEIPKGKVAHHVKPVAEGGKTIKSNIRVISEAKHKQVHANRKKIGRV